MSEKDSPLDITLSEISAYKQLYGWIKYGDYVNMVRPKLEKEGKLGEITGLAEKIRKEKKERGKTDVKSDKLHKHR